MWIKFSLLRYKYSIVMRKGYLGAYTSAKKPRIGEDWLRGNDLKDGKLNLRTWFFVIKDIFSHEFYLGRWKKSTSV